MRREKPSRAENMSFLRGPACWGRFGAAGDFAEAYFPEGRREDAESLSLAKDDPGAWRERDSEACGAAAANAARSKAMRRIPMRCPILKPFRPDAPGAESGPGNAGDPGGPRRIAGPRKS